MGIRTTTPGTGGCVVPRDEYDRLTDRLFELSERKQRIEGTIDRDELDGHDEYRVVTTELESVLARMDSITGELIDQRNAEAIYRVLL